MNERGLDTENRGDRLREALEDDRLLLLDGAMGTLIYSRGVFLNECYEELNITRPELVRGIHEAYARAGADLLETNTYGGNPVKLSAHGLDDQTEELNRAAAQLARDVAGDRAWVLGAIGPLGIRIEPWGPTSREETERYFARQVTGLADGGVDGFVLETFSDLDELEAAFRAVRSVSNLPTIAQISVGIDGSTSYGTTVETFAEHMERAKPDVVGLNCAIGPAAMLEAVERLARATRYPVSALPNAGLPRMVAGRAMYLSSPDYMGRYARRMVEAGARLVGGCCGTTPDHIRMARQAIDATRPRSAVTVQVSEHLSRETGEEPQPLAERSPLGAALARDRFLVTAEIIPPRGWDPVEMLAESRRLRDAGADAVHVLDTPLAKSRMGVIPAALLIEKEVGVETVFHYTCRDRNMLGMHSDLLGAAAAGLRNILVVTGDPPVAGAYPDSTAVFDIDSIGLTNLVHHLNQGLDPGGESIGRPTRFVIGVALSHGARDLESELRRFYWKVDAGADFAVTQPVFDARQLLEVLDALGDLRLPTLAGVWPLVSLRSAEYLANEVPGIRVPEEVVERMRHAQQRGPDAAREEGISIALEVCEAIRDSVDGIQVNFPRNGRQSVLRVIEAIRSVPRGREEDAN